MAIQVGSLEASLSLNASSFITGMNNASTALTQTNAVIKQQTGVMANLASQMNNVTGAVGKVAGALQSVKRFAGVGLGAIGAYTILPGIFGAAKSAVIDFNQQVDQASVALTNFLGSAQASKKMIADLQDFAARTPFQFKDLLGTVQSMMAMGVAADDVLPRMQAIGDAAAAMGGSPETLYRIQRALGQIQAKGRVQSEELLQLAEAGIPAYQYLAEALGTTTAAMLGDLRKGTVDAHTAINAVLDGMTRDFGGMMEEQAKTMMGALSTVKDYVQMTIGAISRPLFNVFRDTFVAMAKFLSGKTMENASKKLAETLTGIFNSIKSGLVVAVKLATPAFKQMGDAIAKLFAVAVNLAKALAPMISLVATVLVGAFIAAASAIAPIANALASVIGFFGRFQIVVQTVAALLMTMWIKSIYASATANSVLSRSLLHMISRFGIVGKTFSATFGMMRSVGQSTFASLRTAASLSFTAMTASVRAFGAALMTSLGPLVAITAAIYIATKAFMAFSNRNKDAKERTKELAESLKQNKDAIKESTDEIAKSLGNWRGITKAIIETGENGDKTSLSMLKLGLNVSDAAGTLISFKNNTRKAVEEIAMMNGETEQSAKLIADYVVKYDKDAVKVITATTEMTESQKRLALMLEELDDQSENLNLQQVVDAEIAATIAADKNSAALANQAQILVDNRIAAGEKLDGDKKAIALYQEFTKLYQKYNEELKKSSQAMGQAGDGAYNAVAALQELVGTAKDGKIEVEGFTKAIYGQKAGQIALTRSNREMRTAFGEVIGTLKEAKGSTEKFTRIGYELFDVLNENGAAMMNMGASAADVERMMKDMVNEFTRQAKAAGYSDEQIQALLKSLGILDAMQITTQVRLDLAQAVKDLETYKKILMATGVSEYNIAKVQELEATISELKGSLKSTGDFARMTWDSIGSNAEKGGSKTETAADKARKRIENMNKAMESLKETMLDFSSNVGDALAETLGKKAVFNFDNAKKSLADFQTKVAGLKRVTPATVSEFNTLVDTIGNQFVEALDNANAALQDAKDAFNDFRNSVAGSVRQTFGTLSDAYGKLKDSQSAFTDAQADTLSAQENLNEALARENELREDFNALISDPTSSPTAVASAYDKYAKAVQASAKASESLTKAQSAEQLAGTEAGKSFLDRMTEQAQAGLAFSDKIKQLISMGLSEGALKQVLDAGVDAGTAIADELITSGSSAIAKTNELVNAAQSAADQVGILAAQRWYQAGIDNAQNQVNGLVAQIQALTPEIMKVMDDLAERMKRQVTIDVKISQDKFNVEVFVTKKIREVITQQVITLTSLDGTRANGGPVRASGLYLVGENGPELFSPNRSGHISTNADLRGGMGGGVGGNTYNINVNAGMGANGAEIGDQIVDALKRYQRRNGALPLTTV